MSIFEFAIKMEMDGKVHYEKLADETVDRGVKAIFTTLAADEQKHYETIQAIMSGTAWLMKHSVVLESAKHLFSNIRSNEAIACSLRKSLERCELARKIEAESVRFYENSAHNESNYSTRQLLLRIAEEEKHHYNILENFYDFSLTPMHCLTWKEFSNLSGL
jgi:rubrerythrin